MAMHKQALHDALDKYRVAAIAAAADSPVKSQKTLNSIGNAKAVVSWLLGGNAGQHGHLSAEDEAIIADFLFDAAIAAGHPGGVPA